LNEEMKRLDLDVSAVTEAGAKRNEAMAALKKGQSAQDAATDHVQSATAELTSATDLLEQNPEDNKLQEMVGVIQREVAKLSKEKKNRRWRRPTYCSLRQRAQQKLER
jgi:hypothetical protein